MTPKEIRDGFDMAERAGVFDRMRKDREMFDKIGKTAPTPEETAREIALGFRVYLDSLIGNEKQSPSDWLADRIAAAIRAARIEALEEAAREAAIACGKHDCTRRIRALIGREKGKL